MFGVINGKLDYKIKKNEEAVIATAFFNYKNETCPILINNHYICANVYVKS